MKRRPHAKARAIRITAKGYAILAALDAGTYRTITGIESCANRKRGKNGRFSKAQRHR